MLIEVGVHRWDAESATGTARPIDTELAVDSAALRARLTAQQVEGR